MQKAFAAELLGGARMVRVSSMMGSFTPHTPHPCILMRFYMLHGHPVLIAWISPLPYP